MKKIAALSFVFLFSAQCFADFEISDLELGVLTCIESTTNLGSENANPEKEKIVNEIFKEVGVSKKYDASVHSNVRERYKLKVAFEFSEGYSACDSYIYKIDPDGKKYTSNEY